MEFLRLSMPDVPRTPGLAPDREEALFWSRLAEFVALYAAFPLVLYFTGIGRLLIPLLVVSSAFCVWMLVRDPEFDRRRLWNFGAARADWARVLGLFGLGAVLITGAVLVLRPELFLNFPRRNAAMWAFVMVFYPLLSVYPQEVIFRAFLHHRYRAVFPSRASMIAASGAAFGFAHVILHNPVAVVLTMVGGVLFAWTYERTRSLAAVCVEHALYGCMLFTVGLGSYLFAGAAHR